MADVYLIANAPYGASDVLLTTVAASGVTTTAAPSGGHRSLIIPHRKVVTGGSGHAHIRLELHGEPGGVLAVSARVRSSAVATVAATTAAHGRLVSNTPVARYIQATTRATTRSTVTRTLAAHGQIRDAADLWLLLDLPELT